MGWSLALPRRRRLGRRAVASIEFAIIMSYFLVVFIGTFEILTLLRTDQKVNILAATVAQAYSIQSAGGAAISASTPQDICFGAVKGLSPDDGSGLTIDVASVTSVTPGSTVSYWEQDFSGKSCTAVTPAVIGAAGACNLATGNGNGGMLPAANGAVGDNAIIVKVSVTYPGLVGLWLSSAPTLSQQVMTRWAYASTSAALTVTGVTPQTITCSG